MKAATFTEPGEPKVLTYRDISDPVCGARDVVVRTRAIGLNFADIYRRRGQYGIVPPSPFVLGYEAAGVVNEIGAEVTRFRKGDRVVFANVPRANAELVLAPEDKLIKIPDPVSFEEAAGIALQGMTAHYLTRDSHLVRPGETVLVHSGGGGVGGLVLQYAKAAGAFTIATVSSDEKGEVAREAGADAVIVTSRTHWTDEVARLGRAHRGIDVVYDAVGSTLLESLRVVRNRGHVIFYGWAGGPAPGVDPRTLMDRSLRLSGGDLWSHIDNPEDLQSRAAEVFSDLERGTIRLRIDRKFSLADAAEAHAYLESRQARGKVLLVTADADSS